MHWLLCDTTGVVRRGLTEPQVRQLVRINESPAVYGRHDESGAEIRWEDVQHDPLPPGHEDSPTTRRPNGTGNPPTGRR